MGCLPRSALFFVTELLSLTRSLNLVVHGERVKIQSNIRRNVTTKIVLHTVTIHLEIRTIRFRQLNSTIRKDTGQKKPASNTFVRNKMHKAFSLPVMKFPLPVKNVPTAEEKQCHYCEDCTATKVKEITLNPNPLHSQSLHQEIDQQNPTFAKIPILDIGKFEQWQFIIQQYLQHEHYALWEVIEFGDSYEVPGNVTTTGSASDGTGKKKGRTVTLTTDDMQKRKNDRNRSDLDTMSLDDLYNHLKVYESEVQKKSEPNSQNMAFISLVKHSSGNEQVNTPSVSIASTNVSTASANIGVKKTRKKISIQGTDVAGFDKSKVKCFNCHKMGYFARKCRAPRSQDRERRDNYRQGSKIEEQAPKALMAIDRVGWDWSYMANDEENHALIADEETPIEFALMAKTNAKSEVFDNYLCSKASKKNYDSLNSKITELTDKLCNAKNMVYHYKLALAEVEARLAKHRNQELKYYKKIRVLEFQNESRANCIESLTKDLEVLKKEKGELETKLTGFQTASKDLDSLLESLRLDKNKEGLGYSAVPPLPTQSYYPPKKDMYWTGLPKCKDDTVTDYSRPSLAIESTSDDAQNINPSVTKTEASPRTISPKPFIKFVKANDSLTKSKTDKVKTAKKPPVKYAEQYRKPTKKPNGSSQNNIDDKGYWDSGCSRHMTGNISYLSDYEPFDGGYVSLGQGGCKITGNGTIKTGKLEFENVDFKLLDDANVLLRTPMQHNMYSINLNNIVPHKDLTCLVAKASEDEGMLWHKRLGHLNFKTINREAA
nr:hypothetical protein [Tanacetum cinerariifolium]